MSPLLDINLDKIRYNTAQVREKCRQQGIAVLGVTKGFSAMPQIVSAMLAGGADGLADSRMENIIELRNSGFTQPITLLRIPELSDVENVVRYADISVNSEITVMEALAETAQKTEKSHQVILMVDVGDLREGILKEHVLETAKQISRLKGVRLLGLGTNMGCFGGVLPSTDNLGLLVELGFRIENQLGFKLEVISGGGTSTLLLVENRKVPAGINQLRIGEGILLGTDTTNQRKISWLWDDAFVLSAEVIELKSKPSVPMGDIGRDAFGNVPEFVDIGIRKRAILALGKQDVYIEGIVPVDGNLKILGASSDHLIVDVTDTEQDIKVGDNISFQLTYSGLVSASHSRYVAKKFREVQ
ncbi:MAG TPA: alanine/ornithine racemase family PLP-dependent enzyme [Methylomusa anaerophila]|uniref:Alanine racemase n=1 Tax=Methylomusa anaerophila TaxID=1930071 RepID=A0A348AJA8_9FIRM|nr:alanine/ornithine racemase family PLP-dependent enzyme [Methylomusa anaerophila]BBB91156.1 alanine racemase [Methylomusa anaerophila]HML89034.1 alanine/ornithine racemase family PLP-dependent enzyme [Methylomusa anaerophila]